MCLSQQQRSFIFSAPPPPKKESRPSNTESATFCSSIVIFHLPHLTSRTTHSVYCHLKCCLCVEDLKAIPGKCQYCTCLSDRYYPSMKEAN